MILNVSARRGRFFYARLSVADLKRYCYLFDMEIYLVPFSLLDVVIMSPVYAYITWFFVRRILKIRGRRFTGFLSWSYIIHSAVIPFFWILHGLGLFRDVEAENTSFDPVQIDGHAAAFLSVYILVTGGITMLGLMYVKRNSPQNT